jgi:sulfur carrier protein
MKLTVNGSPTDASDGATVAAVVTDLAGAERSRGIAVAVNGDVVPRSTWSTTTLRDGDTVEVLTAVQGG